MRLGDMAKDDDFQPSHYCICDCEVLEHNNGNRNGAIINN